MSSASWIGKNKRYLPLFAMLAPGVVYYTVYKYCPFIGLLVAFKDYQVTRGIFLSRWAAPLLRHFRAFIESPYFGQVLANTLILSALKLFFGTAAALVLAVLLSEVRARWFQRMMQTITYLPHFLSWVIVYGVVYALFSESSGIVALVLRGSFGVSFPVLSDPGLFRSLLVASEIWKEAGWGAIIYLAAISGVDPTLYEAARMDGASRLRQIWHVTLSGIRDTVIIVLLLNLGKILDGGFDQVYVMQNLQVQEVSYIVDLWVYRTGLEQFNFSLAAAVGLMKSVVSFSLLLGVNLLARRWGETLW